MVAESIVYCYSRLPGLAGSDGDVVAADDGNGTSSSSSSNSAVGQKRKQGSSAAATKSAKARADQCTWTGKLKDAAAHFRECDYAGVVCSFQGCGAVVARKDKAGHEATCDHRTTACKWEGCDVKVRKGAELDQHEAECPRRVITCPNAGCGSSMSFDSMATHKAHYCQHEEIPCPFAAQGCTARMLRKDVDSHEDTAMKQHFRLMMKTDSEQQQLVESLKDQVMPDSERIVLQVKHDELTGKVPFVPLFPHHPTRLFSQDRVVRGYAMRLFVQTKKDKPEDQDHYGVYLAVEGGPFPCKVNFTFELAHHDRLPASAFTRTDEHSYTESIGWGFPKFIAKARLASPVNNPYVKDGYLTFKCTFKFV
jgi:hypothetical protein